MRRAAVGLDSVLTCRDLAGALRDPHQALEGFQVIAGRDPQNMEARRDVARAYQGTGIVLGEASRRQEALETDRKALAIYEELNRADPTSGENASYITSLRTRIGALERDKSDLRRSK